jgi:hypothetical protein
MLNPNAKLVSEPFPANPKGKKSSQKSFIRQVQDRQDDIFRKMSADRKIEVGSQLWRLAKDLVGDKMHYGRNRSKTSSGGDSKDTR